MDDTLRELDGALRRLDKSATVVVRTDGHLIVERARPRAAVVTRAVRSQGFDGNIAWDGPPGPVPKASDRPACRAIPGF